MKVLIFGDITGQVGKDTITEYAPKLINHYKPELVIANGENMGPRAKGITKGDFRLLMDLGVNFVTMGNHTFDNYQIYDVLKENDNIIRPLNLDGEQPGVGTRVITVKNKKVRISNFMGKVFMNDLTSNPFVALEKLVNDDKSDIHIIDFHAEATAEKMIFGTLADKMNKVTCVFGTHTHTQTSDERLLPNGTAFITDIGMNGAFNSSLGLSLNEIQLRMKTGLPQKYKEADGPGQVNGIVLTIDDKTNKATAIERINITPQKP
jgi:metallophosphoesterase (TIGR00282 family)